VQGTPDSTDPAHTLQYSTGHHTIAQQSLHASCMLHLALTNQPASDSVLAAPLPSTPPPPPVLTWTLYLLAQNPDVMKRIQDEVRTCCAVLCHVMWCAV
jgi:hypothetical protein